MRVGGLGPLRGEARLRRLLPDPPCTCSLDANGQRVGDPCRTCIGHLAHYQGVVTSRRLHDGEAI